MTDMTPDEINKRIATWLGLKCTCKGAYWGACEMHSNGGVATDYYHTNAAIDLLGALVERGYEYCLENKDKEHQLTIWKESDLVGFDIEYSPALFIFSKYTPTIPAAICTAILELIEMEGR